jgi:hypothetical protein
MVFRNSLLHVDTPQNAMSLRNTTPISANQTEKHRYFIACWEMSMMTKGGKNSSIFLSLPKCKSSPSKPGSQDQYYQKMLADAVFAVRLADAFLTLFSYQIEYPENNKH